VDVADKPPLLESFAVLGAASGQSCDHQDSCSDDGYGGGQEDPKKPDRTVEACAKVTVGSTPP